MVKYLRPHFISCSQDDFIEEYLKNNPVNIAKCQELRKGLFISHICDEDYNCEEILHPSIKFMGCGDAEWIYKTEDDRNAEFDNLRNNKFLSNA